MSIVSSKDTSQDIMIFQVLQSHHGQVHTPLLSFHVLSLKKVSVASCRILTPHKRKRYHCLQSQDPLPLLFSSFSQCPCRCGVKISEEPFQCPSRQNLQNHHVPCCCWQKFARSIQVFTNSLTSNYCFLVDRENYLVVRKEHIHNISCSASDRE